MTPREYMSSYLERALLNYKKQHKLSEKQEEIFVHAFYRGAESMFAAYRPYMPTDDIDEEEK